MRSNKGLKRLRRRRSIRHDRLQGSGAILVPYRAERRAGRIIPLEPGSIESLVSATLSYVKPSTVFKPYQNAALDELAAELDALVEAIVRTAMEAS